MDGLRISHESGTCSKLGKNAILAAHSVLCSTYRPSIRKSGVNIEESVPVELLFHVDLLVPKSIRFGALLVEV